MKKGRSSGNKSSGDYRHGVLDMLKDYSSGEDGGPMTRDDLLAQMRSFYRKNAPVSGGIGGLYNALERAAYVSAPNKGLAGSNKGVSYN